MDNLLDKTGVKRLLSNIKDWVSNKFVDSDNKLYYSYEIEELRINNKLKIGKSYNIFINDYEQINYKYGIRFDKDEYINTILLKAITNNTFDKKATLIRLFEYDVPEENLYLECEFEYGNFNYVNNPYLTNSHVIIFDSVEYYLSKYLSYYDVYEFKSSTDATYDKIYVKPEDLKEGNKEIIIYSSPSCSSEDSFDGYLYYNGIGIITYIKDETGNEAPFDFVNFTINGNFVISGSNNIIKSFDPENPMFINGSYNFINLGCKNINMDGNDNFIDIGCQNIAVQDTHHCKIGSYCNDIQGDTIEYLITKNNCNYIRLDTINDCIINEECVNLIIQDANHSLIGKNCFALNVTGTCKIGNYNNFNIIYNSDTEDYVTGMNINNELDIVKKTNISFYNNKTYYIGDILANTYLELGNTQINDYLTIDYYKDDNDVYILEFIFNFNINYNNINIEEIYYYELLAEDINKTKTFEGILDEYHTDDNNLVLSFILGESNSGHILEITSFVLQLCFVDDMSINTNNGFIISME